MLVFNYQLIIFKEGRDSPMAKLLRIGYSSKIDDNINGQISMKSINNTKQRP